MTKPRFKQLIKAINELDDGDYYVYIGVLVGERNVTHEGVLYPYTETKFHTALVVSKDRLLTILNKLDYKVITNVYVSNDIEPVISTYREDALFKKKWSVEDFADVKEQYGFKLGWSIESFYELSINH